MTDMQDTDTATSTMNTATNYEGCGNAACGEHRTVGPHRAWCFACSEWCYPEQPCARGEVEQLRATTEQQAQTIEGLQQQVNMERAYADEKWQAAQMDRAAQEAIEGLRAALERYMAGHPCKATDECPTKNEALAAIQQAKGEGS